MSSAKAYFKTVVHWYTEDDKIFVENFAFELFSLDCSLYRISKGHLSDAEAVTEEFSESLADNSELIDALKEFIEKENKKEKKTEKIDLLKDWKLQALDDASRVDKLPEEGFAEISGEFTVTWSVYHGMEGTEYDSDYDFEIIDYCMVPEKILKECGYLTENSDEAILISEKHVEYLD